MHVYDINPADRSEVLSAVSRAAFAAAWQMMPGSPERIGFAAQSDAGCLAMMLPTGAITRAGDR